MPKAAKRICPRHAIAYSGQCPRCKLGNGRTRAANADEGERLYQRSKWHRASRAYRAANPYCVLCGNPSECVDHIIPHRGDVSLFWDEANWQALCHRCNGVKSRYDNDTRTGKARKVVVAGPPRSGKTTLVEQQRRPGDVVFDFDALLLTMTQTETATEATRHLMKLVREAVQAWSVSHPDVDTYVIVSDHRQAVEVAKDMRAELLLVESTEAECCRRIDADERPRKPQRKAAVRKWFDDRARQVGHPYPQAAGPAVVGGGEGRQA